MSSVAATTDLSLAFLYSDFQLACDFCLAIFFFGLPHRLNHPDLTSTMARLPTRLTQSTTFTRLMYRYGLITICIISALHTMHCITLVLCLLLTCSEWISTVISVWRYYLEQVDVFTSQLDGEFFCSACMVSCLGYPVAGSGIASSNLELGFLCLIRLESDF